VIDQDLLTEIQLALLEPADGGQSWPSEVWTHDEVLGNLNSRIWKLLRDTHAIVTRVEIAVPAAGLGVVALPAAWIATVSGVWRTAGGLRSPLGPADSYETDLALPTWGTTPGTPLVMHDLDRPTLTLQLAPIPDADGTLELLYVARPTALTGAGATIGLPDELLSGVKYGTLGMLLRKAGRLADPERAAYCEDRFALTTLAVELLLRGGA
jgi:hypothetical protein